LVRGGSSPPTPPTPPFLLPPPPPPPPPPTPTSPHPLGCRARELFASLCTVKVLLQGILISFVPSTSDILSLRVRLGLVPCRECFLVTFHIDLLVHFNPIGCRYVGVACLHKHNTRFFLVPLLSHFNTACFPDWIVFSSCHALPLSLLQLSLPFPTHVQTSPAGTLAPYYLRL